MKHNPSPLSNLYSLAAQWRLLGFLCIAFARRVLVLERSGARDAYAKADALEAFTCAALGELIPLIASDPPEAETSPKETAARECLKVVFAAMAGMMLLARRVKQRLAASLKTVFPVTSKITRGAVNHRLSPPDYIDTS